MAMEVKESLTDAFFKTTRPEVVTPTAPTPTVTTGYVCQQCSPVETTPTPYKETTFATVTAPSAGVTTPTEWNKLTPEQTEKLKKILEFAGKEVSKGVEWVRGVLKKKETPEQAKLKQAL
jgi:hypothetical protein